MSAIGPRIDHVRSLLEGISDDLARARSADGKVRARAIERYLDAAQRELDVASDYGHGLDRRRAKARGRR